MRGHPPVKHWGVDFGSYGKNIDCLAVEEGAVIEASVWKVNNNSDYGTYVSILHPNGYVSRYAHLHSIAPGISVGAKVKAQQKIGLVGTTGRSSGEHLHFEILSKRGDQNSRIDSLPYAKGGKKLREEEKMTQEQFMGMFEKLTPEQSNGLFEKALKYRSTQPGSERIKKEFDRAVKYISNSAIPPKGFPTNEESAVRSLRIADAVVAEAMNKKEIKNE